MTRILSAMRDDLRGHKVFILSVSRRHGEEWTRPDPIPFGSLDDLHRHVCDLVTKELFSLDDKHRKTIIPHLETRDYHAVIMLFRAAQHDNETKIPLDFYWDESASLIM